MNGRLHIQDELTIDEQRSYFSSYLKLLAFHSEPAKIKSNI